jgi:hypothetical protein
MYLLDPDEALSRDELLQKIWDVGLTPPMRAKVLANAQLLAVPGMTPFVNISLSMTPCGTTSASVRSG